jgi:hypothetical protein
MLTSETEQSSVVDEYVQRAALPCGGKGPDRGQRGQVQHLHLHLGVGSATGLSLLDQSLLQLLALADTAAC